MNVLVIFASRFGNTEKIAYAIATGLENLGSVRVVAAENVDTPFVPDADLLVIGGPTEGHFMTTPVRRVLQGFAPGGVKGLAAAAFDTRFRLRRLFTGSAAVGIRKRLRRAGAVMVLPEESFFVRGKVDTASGEGPELEPGELERAASWAAGLARKMTQPRAA